MAPLHAHSYIRAILQAVLKPVKCNSHINKTRKYWGIPDVTTLPGNGGQILFDDAWWNWTPNELAVQVPWEIWFVLIVLSKLSPL